MMKKRFAAAFTAAVLCAVSAFPGIVCPSARAEGAEKMLLNGENFNIPSYTNGGYVTNGGSALNNIFEKSIKITNNGNSVFSTARIYIETEGTYNIWVLSGNENGVADRFATVCVDDGAMQSLTPHRNHEWDGTEWNLSEGWHEIRLGICGAWKNTLINAVYITNDADFVPSTDGDDTLLAFSDNEAPVIADGEAAVRFEGENCFVKFPEAAGEDKIYYEYVINGAAHSIDNISEEAAIGAVFGETTVTLRASDKFGNSDERSFTVKAPELVLSSDGFLLTYKNFTVPSFQNGGLVSAGSGAVGDKSIKVNGEDTSLGAEARFYAAEDGDYALWLLSGNGDNIPERHAAAYIDGERDLSAFNATTVLTWNKGLAADGSGVWHLKKGWHTVKLALSGAWLPYLANAVYITNDLDFEVTPELVPVITEQQSDTEAPVFGRTSVESEYTDVSECKLIIPEASDSSTVVSLLCYINGELREITGGYVQLTGLKPLEEVSVRVEAFDKFNNKATLDDTYAASPVRADGFAIYGQDGTALSGAETLKSGSTIYTSAVLTNKTGTDIETELSLCIYNADYTRMLLCKNVKVKLAANAENAAIRAEISVPQSKSGLAAGAMLWNAASSEPLICGTETGGAR